MSELLPTLEADTIRESLLDYLTTTFALADEDARTALAEFLADPKDGIFKGPYIRLRLPYQPADAGWEDTLEWYGGFPPYGHQAAAFRRLSSLGLKPGERPKPTLITTGTGSGKTEAFLFPILDHVRRAKRAGITGMKALLLYPMNALANDQAGRLASLITGHPELEGVTAALYTGQHGPERTRITADGLITSRREIRDNPPDILLTNYKMLDQLLLRADDAVLWERSATSLQYLVLDEFHTYDGAQGTDVSMLLRRLGLALKSYWQSDDSTLTSADWARPLGRLTPVATSATLGDKGDPVAMLHFARTVFGEDFGADAVITEARLSFEQWSAGAAEQLRARGLTLPERSGPRADIDLVTRVTDAVHKLGEEVVGDRLAHAVLTELWSDGTTRADVNADDPELLLDLVKAHPLTATLVAATEQAIAVSDLTRAAVVDRALPATDAAAWAAQAERFIVDVLGAISHVRAAIGRAGLTVDLHLWIRELTRIDRIASVSPIYLWSDDGEVAPDSDLPGPPLPALYCRHCGRSGWAVVLAPTGTNLDTDDTRIRTRRLQNDDRFRALIHAPTEGQRARDGEHDEPNLRWFHVDERRLITTLPADDEDLRTGRVLPVLVHIGEDAGTLSIKDTCPSCLHDDGIRFLGSAIATLLSVTLSTLFGQRHLDDREKKALVFTDSVQDAAHRAGFIQSRSHALTLRSLIRAAVADTPVSLEELVERIIADAGDDPHRRYRILPPDLADRETFAPFWRVQTLRKVPVKVLKRVKQRLLLDLELEFGLQSGVGRTLERTGSLAVEVDVAESLLRRCAQRALEEAGGILDGLDPDAAQLVAWARGLLTRMRQQGAFDHDWFARYRREDGNRWSIWGGRRRSEGMPAFPKGRAAPGYPRIGGVTARDTDLEPVASARGWYAKWTSRALGVPAAEGAALARLLVQQLAKHEVLLPTTTESNATVYALPASAVVVYPVDLPGLQGGRYTLRCTVCESLTPATVTVVRQLTGAPCLVARCGGVLEPFGRTDNFYRRLYASTDIRRVIAREHTSLLTDAVRLEYETAFKQTEADPKAPNVLVATPTLELGIDIGDLSTVMLASLPRSVASYLQRVGRAGRLTGNSLVLAYVTGRGEHLPRLGEPLSVINGQVRPPATYLDAEEILRRQLLAFLADTLARDPAAPHPARAAEAIGTTEPGSYLHALIAVAETRPELTEAFLAGFPALAEVSRMDLQDWVRPRSETFGSSPFGQRVHDASRRWNHTVETLQHRRQEIQDSLPELEQRANSPAAIEEDKAAHHAAEAGFRLTGKQLADLLGEYWIGVLEEHGLLPNYTLLDDSVTLDVAISWIDPDTGDYQTEPHDFTRGSALALRDFAPGATFYANGYAITVDAVDLGRNAEAIRPHAVCASCGYVQDITDTNTTLGACPRCGDGAFADLRQRLDVVELEKVSSAISRERATIDDSREDRERTQYTVITAADVDPTKVSRQWYVDGYGFGAKYLREMTIRWLNLGRTTSRGTGRRVAGESLNAPLFRVCGTCGHQDTATGRNTPQEHRPWCPHRRAAGETTRSIALSRTLRTEGLILRLPRTVTLGDRFAVPSLAAALLLGLRERIGGHPDHLDVTAVIDPTPDGSDPNEQALLLHDVVPGGTGYLAELADPTTVWTILHTAWDVVRQCPCQEEGRLACHRCLLPFTGPGREQWVSRAAAERHLHEILTADPATNAEVPAAMPWHCTEEEPHIFDTESLLEQRFRAVLRTRLEAAGATVTENPTAKGNEWTIRIAGRQWRLQPQEDVHGARPDFVLHAGRPDIPDVAIFTDGWLYHASVTNNRLADDASKREVLRLNGMLVLAVTWQDLDTAEGDERSPSWYTQHGREQVLALSGGALKPALVDLVTRSSIDILLHWLQEPDPGAFARLGDWLPLLMLTGSTPVAASGDNSLTEVAASVLRGEATWTDGPATTWVYRDGGFALAARFIHDAPRMDDPGTLTTGVSVLLDDEHLEDSSDAWRAWLHASNLLALRQAPTTITVTSLAAKATALPAEATPATRPPAPSPAGQQWADLYEDATPQERAVIDMVWTVKGPRPTVGFETEIGVPLPISWPERHVAVDLDLEEDERRELIADGWRFIAADLEAIRTVLSTAEEHA